MQGERPDQRRERASPVARRPRGRVHRVGVTIGALNVERAGEPANSCACELERQIVKSRPLAVTALQRGITVEFESPAADPLAGSGMDRPGADDPGRAPGAGPQNAPGEARGEHLERRGGHHRGVRVLSPEQPPVLIGDRDAPFTASPAAGLPEPGLDRLLDPGGIRRQGRDSRRSGVGALPVGGPSEREGRGRQAIPHRPPGATPVA